jgi:hypothetical protein
VLLFILRLIQLAFEIFEIFFNDLKPMNILKPKLYIQYQTIPKNGEALNYVYKTR